MLMPCLSTCHCDAYGPQVEQLHGLKGFGLKCYVSVSTITAIDGDILVYTNERTTQVHSARSSLVVTHLSTNRGRRALTSVNVPLS